MKRTVLVLFLGICAVGCVGPDEAEAELLFRHHFIGGTSLSRDTNSAKLKSLWALPETAPMWKEVSGKLATAPFRALKSGLPAEAEAGAALVQPLIESLMRSESCSDVQGPLDRPEAVLAVRLDAEQAELWSTNLWKLLEGWKQAGPKPVKVGEYAGWEAALLGRVMQFYRAGEWVVLGVGTGQLTLAPRVLGKIAEGSSPAEVTPGAWWSVRADLGGLKSRFPWLSELPLGELDYSSRGEGENLRTTGNLTLTRPLPKSLEAWSMPTNSIMDNIASFTAVRGLRTLLGSAGLWKRAGLRDAPSQLTAWGPNVQFSGILYAAAPYEDPTNVVFRLAPHLPKMLSEALQPKLGKFAYASNSASISMVGLPYVLPHIKAMEQEGQGYLVFGMFPMSPATTRPPVELLGQLGDRKDLVYYDWEITQHRLFHARQIYQLLDIVRGLSFGMSTSPSQRWVTALAPQLGNTITEAVMQSPTRLSFSRKSHMGLTGFEIYTLVAWMESPGFPLTWEKNAVREPLTIEQGRERRGKTNSRPPGLTPAPKPASTPAPAPLPRKP